MLIITPWGRTKASSGSRTVAPNQKQGLNAQRGGSNQAGTTHFQPLAATEECNAPKASARS
jgi:hypothetical protein